MDNLEVEGIVYEADQHTRDQAVQFYDSLYQENEAWRPKFDGLPFDVIREEDREFLERKFEKDEILQVLHSSQGDKSPSSDGFTMGFFQKC